PFQDPVPAFAREVLTLFRETLSEVHFPSLDREVLESASEAVRAAQAEAEKIERQLVEARARVAAEVEALSGLSHRALAYARIYAETDETLAQEVERIAQSQPGAALSPARKRGRPRRASDDDAGLFQGVTLTAPTQEAALAE